MATFPLAQVLRNRKFRVGGSLVVSAALLWLALREVDLDAAVRSLQSAHWGWIAVALALYWLELAVRIGRWHLMLGSIGRLRIRAVWTAFIVGYAANNVLPARMGELLRADLIGRTGAIARLAALGTIVFERLLDMIVVTLCALFGLAEVLDSSGSAKAVAQGMAVSIALIVGTVLAIFLLWFMRAGDLGRFPRAKAWIEALHAGLAPARRPRLLLSTLVLSALIWSINGGVVWAIIRAVGLHIGVAEILVLLGIGGIAAAIPSAPASLGTLQFAFVAGFSLLRLPVTSGFLAAFLIQLFLFGSVSIVGWAAYATAIVRGGSAPTASSSR
jgi:glycosyltransferase 2 family protein